MTQIVTIPGQGDAEFPDNMTHEQIAGAIRKSFPVMDEKAKKVPRSLLGRAGDLVQGVGEAGLAGVTGTVAEVGNRIGTLAGIVASGHLGDQKAQNEASGPPSLTGYQPPSETGQNVLETLGRVTEASKLEGLAPTAAGGVNAGPAALRQGRQAATVAERAAVKTGQAAVKAGGAVADKAAQVLTPMPEPRVAALAKKAVDLGIPLRPDQLSKNPVARMVGEALEKVPLSGSKAKQRQVGFNRALGTLIGAEESDHLTPDVFDRAMTKAGEKIGEIAAQTPIQSDYLISRLDATEQALSKEKREGRLIVRGYINELKGAVKDGSVDGTLFRKINSDLGAQIRRTTDGDLRHALGELQGELHDVLEKNIASPEKLAELKDAKKKYAIGMTLEPLVAKATTTGDISPGGLLGRVTADKAGKRRMARGQGGEIGDLAEIGKLFLKEPPSSGTAERALAYGTVGGLSAGAFLEPHTAAAAGATIAGANVYNRAGPAIVKRALKNVEAKKNQPRRKKAKEERQHLLREALEAPETEQTPLKKAVGE